MSKAAFLERRVVSLSHQDKTYHVRPLTGLQLETFLGTERDEELDGVNALSRVCCYCACDQHGTRLWDDSDVELIRREVDFDVVKVVAEKALEVSGLGDSVGNG